VSHTSVEMVNHPRCRFAYQEGHVMDAACMVGEPDSHALAVAEQAGLKRFEGARTTAAWNASVFGGAIKVSEDGLISLFVRGKLVGSMG
jgi:hypothetical protein